MRCTQDMLMMTCIITVMILLLIIGLIINKIYSKTSYIITGVLFLGCLGFNIASGVISSQTIDHTFRIYSLNQEENSKFRIEFDTGKDGYWYANVLVKDDNDQLVRDRICLGGYIHFEYDDTLIPAISNHIGAWELIEQTIVVLPSQENLEWVSI